MSPCHFLPSAPAKLQCELIHVLTRISLKGLFPSWEGAKKHNTARTILSPWSWRAPWRKCSTEEKGILKIAESEAALQNRKESVKVHCRDILSWKEAWSQISGIGQWAQPTSQSISISFSYESCGTQAEYELIQIKAKPFSSNDQIFSLAECHLCSVTHSIQAWT